MLLGHFYQDDRYSPKARPSSNDDDDGGGGRSDADYGDDDDYYEGVDGRKAPDASQPDAASRRLTWSGSRAARTRRSAPSSAGLRTVGGYSQQEGGLPRLV